jgi:hypothetical protein
MISEKITPKTTLNFSSSHGFRSIRPSPLLPSWVDPEPAVQPVEPEPPAPAFEQPYLKADAEFVKTVAQVAGCQAGSLKFEGTKAAQSLCGDRSSVG